MIIDNASKLWLVHSWILRNGSWSFPRSLSWWIQHMHCPSLHMLGSINTRARNLLCHPIATSLVDWSRVTANAGQRVAARAVVVRHFFGLGLLETNVKTLFSGPVKHTFYYTFFLIRAKVIFWYQKPWNFPEISISMALKVALNYYKHHLSTTALCTTQNLHVFLNYISIY